MNMDAEKWAEGLVRARVSATGGEVVEVVGYQLRGALGSAYRAGQQDPAPKARAKIEAETLRRAMVAVSDALSWSESHAWTANRAIRALIPKEEDIPFFCCYSMCDKDAEYVVITTRRSGGIAGPDPYSDETHACTEHVGPLLGHQPDADSPVEIYWEIFYLPEYYPPLPLIPKEE